MSDSTFWAHRPRASHDTSGSLPPRDLLVDRISPAVDALLAKAAEIVSSYDARLTEQKLRIRREIADGVRQSESPGASSGRILEASLGRRSAGRLPNRARGVRATDVRVCS